MTQIDLNLVRTFVLLFQTGSVTATAAELSVTQPSVSHGLKRLRKHFADDLFRRTALGLRPTQVAERLYPELQQALEVMDSVVHAVTTFEPRTSTRSFRLLATDLGEVALLPSVLALFRERAPLARVEVTPLDFTTMGRDLRQNDADAAICTPRFTAPDLARDVLLRDRYTGLCFAAHPRIGSAPTLEEYLAERHVVVADASGHVEVDRALERLGSRRDVAIRVPHFTALPRLLERTDLLGVIPGTVSNMFTTLADVRTFDLPLDIAPAEISLYTYKRVLPSPAAEWFRRTICDALQGTAGQSG
ncbi:LysR family transcriptional regulator [Rhodococcus sp. NBC_00294]|uniref:LysR family transcriptional regulator n=1 Tax=Rhodococcus sp. NBC_00294 TaxID=2976004 RepID=UPI002E2978C4|nr:LysR family transcriptional regulator [Rhodococcus sp. NBC_00294]